MKTITVRLRAPDDLSTATLARALNDLGVWVEAVPQHGTNCRAKRLDLADVIPMHRAKRWPGIVPDGAA
jgi:hypothetical protein